MNPDWGYRPLVTHATHDRKTEVRDTHKPMRRHWWVMAKVCRACGQSWPCRQALWVEGNDPDQTAARMRQVQRAIEGAGRAHHERPGGGRVSSRFPARPPVPNQEKEKP